MSSASSMRSSKPVVESDSDLEPNSYCLQKFSVYETQTRFYLIGRDKTRSRWRVLKIDRSEPSVLNISEDPAIYTRQDCNDLLRRLAEGNKKTGGVNFVTKAYGIVGFIKFLEPYHMILITKRRLVGNICGHAIYGIEESLKLTVPHPSVLSNASRLKAENRYKRLFNSIDLTKDFFYSYTYRIMWCIQRNVKSNDVEGMPYDDMFVWNTFLTKEIRSQLQSSVWTVALIHGFFRQVKLSLGDANFTLTLIARRSRHFAGTRYLKRGVNKKGRVANDVETEQLVHEEAERGGQISSVVQHRGSIPLFWSQETSVLSPKPDIVLHQSDPTYEATRKHFEDLMERYGSPVIVLNLVKSVEKKPRETILCREFANSVAYLNHTLPKGSRIKFIQWDLHLFSRRKSTNVLEVLDSIAQDVLDLTGLYYSDMSKQIEEDNHRDDSESQDDANGDDTSFGQMGKTRFQHGVLRSNCIDCLDRTNVAQYAFGLAALGRQMHALGLCSVPRLGSDNGLAIMLMEMYENMGDVLAIQYGGSAAHNKVFSQCQGRWNATIQSLEFFRSIQRHYNNAYLDGEKQEAINLFLGNFRPEIGRLELWQLDPRNHLQWIADDDDLRLSFKRTMSAGNMNEQSNSSSLRSRGINKAATSLNGLGKRGLTISEAEMRRSFAEQEYIGFTTTRQEEPNTCNSLNAESRSLGDCADVDGLSSSGNSCEDDAQERHLVTIADSDSWQGSGLLPDTIEESEVYCEDNEYFQDLTNALLDNKWNYKDASRDEFEELDAYETLQEHDVGSGITRIRSNTPSPGVFSKSFVDWIHKGQTLCY